MGTLTLLLFLIAPPSPLKAGEEPKAEWAFIVEAGPVRGQVPDGAVDEAQGHVSFVPLSYE